MSSVPRATRYVRGILVVMSLDRRFTTAAVAVCAAGVVASIGCGGTQPRSAPRAETIERASFAGTWPFTVDAGELRCEPPLSVVFRAGGEDYGVNGSARDAGYSNVTPIWLEDPSGQTPRVYLGDVTDRGLKLCASS